jgi:hypothetical protein
MNNKYYRSIFLKKVKRQSRETNKLTDCVMSDAVQIPKKIFRVIMYVILRGLFQEFYDIGVVAERNDPDIG